MLSIKSSVCRRISATSSAPESGALGKLRFPAPALFRSLLTASRQQSPRRAPSSMLLRFCKPVRSPGRKACPLGGTALAPSIMSTSCVVLCSTRSLITNRCTCKSLLLGTRRSCPLCRGRETRGANQTTLMTRLGKPLTASQWSALRDVARLRARLAADSNVEAGWELVNTALNN